MADAQVAPKNSISETCNIICTTSNSIVSVAGVQTADGKEEKHSSNSNLNEKIKLSWAGDLLSLKSFIDKSINLEGEWSSPGGEKKIFKSHDGNTIITWWKNKKYIKLDGANAENVKHKLWSIVGNNSSEDSQFATKTDTQFPQISYTYTNQEGRKELTADMEGIKLDMVILETSLEKKIESNINSINSVQEELINMRKLNNELKEHVESLINTRPFDEDNNSNADLLRRENNELKDTVKHLKAELEVCKRRICFAEPNLNQHSTFELVEIKNDDKEKVIDYVNQFPRQDKTKQIGTICPTSIPIPDETIPNGTDCPTPIPIPDNSVRPSVAEQLQDYRHEMRKTHHHMKDQQTTTVKAQNKSCSSPFVVHKYSLSVKETDPRYNYRLQFQDKRKVPDRARSRNYPPCFRKPSQTINTRTRLLRGNPHFRRHPANRPPSHPANRLPPPLLGIHRRHLTNHSSTRLVSQDQRSEWKRYLDFVRQMMGRQTEDSDKR